jgi:hypothetical protein
LIAICRAGQVIALLTISMPAFWSSLPFLSLVRARLARSKATPPPGRIPSSTAALVAFIASSTRRHRQLRRFESLEINAEARSTRINYKAVGADQ